MQWYKYFHEVKDEMFHSTRRSRVEWGFHLSPNENICSIARMKNKKNKQTNKQNKKQEQKKKKKHIHYLFYITAKYIFFSKAKLIMFSQNLLRCNRGTCGFIMHGQGFWIIHGQITHGGTSR